MRYLVALLVPFVLALSPDIREWALRRVRNLLRK